MALGKSNNMPSILARGLGIALLTVLIPLAIVILNDFYQKRREQNIEFVNLDLHLILDRIFGVKRLLTCIFLIFVPMIFWEISPGLFRLLELILSVIGIYFVVRVLLDIYFWIKGNVFEFRFSYLKSLEDHNDLESVWRSVWQTENINTQNEREFFKRFSSTIDQLLKNYERKP